MVSKKILFCYNKSTAEKKINLYQFASKAAQLRMKLFVEFSYILSHVPQLCERWSASGVGPLALAGRAECLTFGEGRVDSKSAGELFTKAHLQENCEAEP